MGTDRFDLGWQSSRAHQLLLTKFLECASVIYFEKYPDWATALCEAPHKAIARFFREELIARPNIAEALGFQRTVPALKGLLRQRNLPISGNKSALLQRLVDADPQGMAVLATGLDIYICTEKGAQLATQFKEMARLEHESALDKTAELFIQGRYQQAVQAMVEYEAKQVFSRGLGIDWKRYPFLDIDVTKLRYIASLRPSILAYLDHKHLDSLRLPAAMMLLWGPPKVDRWLPADKPDNQRFDNDTAARMLLFATIHRYEKDEYKTNKYIKRVKVMCAADACPECQRIANRDYKVSQLPELPHPSCTHENGCRCTMSPVVEW